MSEASSTFDRDGSAGRLLDVVRRETGVERFEVAAILGSGWGAAAQLGETLGIFDYADWPCFPAGQIAGHGGQLVAARLGSYHTLFFSGRFHCYQGLSAYQAAFPVRFSAALGCRRILLTCAAGGINEQFKPGEFMLVEDHVNLLGDNPLRGLPGEIFVDLSDLYESELYDSLANHLIDGLVLHKGVLAAMPGPSYETPAEIRFLHSIGADVVSMSTVPEAIMARYLDMQVAALAFVANPAAGLSAALVSHKDVLDCSHRHAKFFPQLVKLLIETWQSPDSR